MVPDDAVQHGTDGLYVYPSIRTTRPSCARSRSAQSIDGTTVIEEGLKPGRTCYRRRTIPGSAGVGRDHDSREFRAIRRQAAGKARLGMNESISAPFIRYPDRDLAADGRHPVRRPRRVSVAAGRAAAAGRFSDHSGLGQPARRKPRTMASSVAQPLERQFAQIPGIAQMTSTSSLGIDRRSRSSSISTATSTPPPTTSRPRSTPPAANCRKTFRARRPIARSIRPTRRS